MRRSDHLLQPEQRIAPRRFFGKHIQRRTGDVTGFDRRLEIGFDDEIAAGAIDDETPGLVFANAAALIM